MFSCFIARRNIRCFLNFRFNLIISDAKSGLTCELSLWNATTRSKLIVSVNKNIFAMGSERDACLVDAKRVILLKARTGNDEDEDQEKYAAALRSAGFTCTVVSPLRFQFVNIQELRALLQSPHLYSGLILTSPRTVEAVRLALEPVQNQLAPPWITSPSFCVGPATELAAQKFLGLQNCSGSGTGNAEDLARVIISRRSNDEGKEDSARASKELLYPCSAIGRDGLARALDSAGVKYRRIVVYQTLASEDLPKNLEESFKGSLPEFLVFFSPSAFRFVFEELKRKNAERVLERVKIAAIGPVTSKSVEETGLRVHSVSDKPDPASLLRALSGM